MSKKLPVQVRVHVRDLIDEPDSEVQQTLKSLNTAIGSGFTLEITWEDIFRDLKASFSPDDIDKLVPSVARHIIIFVNRLKSVLEQDEGFQEIFLEHYASLLSILAVVIQAGSKTSCRIANRKITLLLPTTGDEGFRYAQSTIGTDLTKLFKEEGDDEVPGAPPATSLDAEDQDWDTVNIVPVKAETSSSKQDNRAPLKFQDAASAKPRPLPKLRSLQRPEVLFADLLPAYLTIKGNEREFFIEGSHAPTIALIAEYFKNYARKDTYDANQSPRFRVDEVTSSFGSGTMLDCVHVDISFQNRDFRANITLFLSFIEGVCGYELVDGKNGCYTYKRTIPF